MRVNRLANLKRVLESRFVFIVPLFIFTVFTWPRTASANDIVRRDPSNLIAVFLDCGYCDFTYIREEITFINYVRDKEQAEVHILVTMQNSGSKTNGRTFTLDFIGLKDFKQMNNTLTYWSPPNNTTDDERKGLTNMIKFGLVPYLANTQLAAQMSLEIYGKPKKPAEIMKDPWDSWAFEIYAGGDFSKEATRGSLNLRYGGSADRITEDWKIRMRPYFNYNSRLFLKDDEEIRTKSYRNGFDGNVVKSVSDHWSMGLFTYFLSSTYHNYDVHSHIAPVVEYSLYPYKEATRKEITFVYRIGGGYTWYLEETIFDKFEEGLFNHTVEASVRFVQPWGSLYARLRGSQYFHDLTASSAELFTWMNIRIASGLSLNLSSRVELINDLLALPKGELSIEDILLQQRRQATNYSSNGSIGLSYTFGSKFNNVVNTRL